MRRHVFPPFPVSPLRWRALTLLVLIMAAGGLDRAALESIVVVARDTLQLPDNGLVVAFKAIGLGFGVALPLGALFAHLAGPRQVLLWSGLGCAGATALMGFAFNVGGATLFYLWFGIAAGMIPAAAVMALARWFPLQNRGLAVGLVLGAWGGSAALLWLGLESLHVRALPAVYFLGLGLLGLVWIAAWLAWYRLPPAPGDAASSWPAASPTADLPAADIALPKVLRHGWPLLCLAFVQSYAIGLCRDWLPAELLALRHQDMLGDPTVLVMGSAAPALGCLVGGALTDRCIAHSHNVLSARQSLIAGGFVLGFAAMLPLLFTTDLSHLVFWMMVALFAFGLGATSLWCLPLDIMAEAPGPLMAFLALGASIGQFLSPVMLAETTGSWMLAFLLGTVFLIGATIGVFFVGPERPQEDETTAMPEEPKKGPRAFSLAPPEMTEDERLLASLRDQGLINTSTRSA